MIRELTAGWCDCSNLQAHPEFCQNCYSNVKSTLFLSLVCMPATAIPFVVARKMQLVEQEETLRDTRDNLEAARRRESAAVSELARRNAEEARRVEQVRALLAASASASGSASAPGSCGGGDRDVADAERTPTAGESSSSSGGDGGGGSNYARGLVLGGGGGGREGFQGVAAVGGTGAGMGVGAAGSSVAATVLSELAALEEAIAERAREVASLKVCMLVRCRRPRSEWTIFLISGNCVPWCKSSASM